MFIPTYNDIFKSNPLKTIKYPFFFLILINHICILYDRPFSAIIQMLFTVLILENISNLLLLCY